MMFRSLVSVSCLLLTMSVGSICCADESHDLLEKTGSFTRKVTSTTVSGTGRSITTVNGVVVSSNSSGKQIIGSGVKGTRRVPFSGEIKSVTLEDDFNYHFDPSYGGNIIVTADDNVLEHLTVSATGGTLSVQAREFSIAKKTPVNVFWGGRPPSRVSITGAGSISLTDFNAEKLAARIVGSGTVVVAGQSQRVNVQISGSGTFDGDDLKIAELDLLVTGSGTVSAYVTESAEGSVLGTGSIKIKGKPKLRAIEIVGAASVRYADAVVKP